MASISGHDTGLPSYDINAGGPVRRQAQPQALTNRRTVSAMPCSSASAVRPWPMETSSRLGSARARAGRLSTVRSWPALMPRPRPAASLPEASSLRVPLWRGRDRHRCRHRARCRTPHGLHRWRLRLRALCGWRRDHRTARRGRRPSSAAAPRSAENCPCLRNPSRDPRLPATGSSGTSVTCSG
jgi:hypothetical protein